MMHIDAICCCYNSNQRFNNCQVAKDILHDVSDRALASQVYHVPGHGDDLDVTNTQTDKESPPSAPRIDGLDGLAPVQPRAAAHAADLHAAADHFEGVRARLGHEAGHGAARQIARRLVFVKVRDVRRRMAL